MSGRAGPSTISQQIGYHAMPHSTGTGASIVPGAGDRVNMQCPHCNATEDYCFSIACWVYLDNGDVVEACGDNNIADPDMPPKACCSNCGSVFGPRPGHIFRIVRGRPQEVELCQENSNQPTRE